MLPGEPNDGGIFFGHFAAERAQVMKKGTAVARHCPFVAAIFL